MMNECNFAKIHVKDDLAHESRKPREVIITKSIKILSEVTDCQIACEYADASVKVLRE